MDVEEIRKLQECTQYFKERKVYRKLFCKVREKYGSLGHFGGTVSLSGLNQEERQQLGGFFQKDFMEQKTITISIAAMEKALKNSRFGGLKWEDILRAYFQEELVAKKEQKRKENLQRKHFFDEMIAEIPVNQGTVWLENILQTQSEGYLLVMKKYRENKEQLRETLKLFLTAVPRLPFLKDKSGHITHELLAVFAAETTENPHFFDAGMTGELLLTAFLKSQIPNSVETTSFRSEQKASLFYEAGLLKDDLSNNTLVYGIGAFGKDGHIHEGIAGFCKRREPMLLTLMTLGKLEKVQPQFPNLVYIVENPAVFAKLIKNFKDATIICGNGQIRLATLVLMDLFDKKTQFRYAGDFDPEGLLIAQKLKERYGERLQLWMYSRKLYETHQSQVEISAKSSKKLDRIYVEELQDVKKSMIQHKKAAYQEAMLEEYIEGFEVHQF